MSLISPAVNNFSATKGQANGARELPGIKQSLASKVCFDNVEKNKPNTNTGLTESQQVLCPNVGRSSAGVSRAASLRASLGTLLPWYTSAR